MPRTRSRSRSQSRSRSRSRSPISSGRRSRSRSSEHDSRNDRPNEYRVHIAELPQGAQESEIRKVFQRFGTLVDVWAASASCFAFVTYKLKEEAQKAIDQMDGRSFGSSRVRVTWARPRARNGSRRFDPNMKCFKCGQRGHFGRNCDGTATERHSSRRRDDDYNRRPPPPPPNNNRYSRSRASNSPPPLPPPAYFRHGMPVYPSFSRRHDDYMDSYYPPPERSNGHERRYRERDTRLTPPSASARYSRR
ncbi:unnamed protein product [Adineta steineri]|uniref:Uncharacterized protein n=1 Tax=Adineta steineri TaxID=433720 RepID=A0A818QRI2_9BILA|nr:unnamed protein product [Adineta steineri]CAF3645442.1 unnamed protein product [Adineta steineri]